MSINPPLNQQKPRQKMKKLTGLKALIRSIHKTPELREWVTIQSVALVPIPVIKNEQWQLISLLVTPKSLNFQNKEWYAPWGAIEWSFPEQQVVEKINLKQSVFINNLPQIDSIINLPANGRKYANLIELIKQEEQLLGKLDQLLQLSPNQEHNFNNLAPFYADILPKEIYPYYWALIPESKTWLTYDNLTKNPEVNSNNSDISLRENPQLKLETPPIIPATVKDLTNYLNNWLHQAFTIAESAKIDNFKTQINQLEKSWLLPGGRLAIVGEFNRGKSNLVNRLLGQNLVPEGVLPTTATLTSISASNQEQMVIYWGNQPPEIRELKEDSWNDLLAIDNTGENQEVVAGVKLNINNSWLQELDIELIDTPGTQDLCDHRAELVFDALNLCDSAILVVHAFFPLSLTEINFLKQELIKRHIPHILVVVSHLDQIPLKDRERVMNNVLKNLTKISPHLCVFPLHPVQENITEIEVINTVKSTIKAMTEKGDRRSWRSQKIAGQLTESLTYLIQLGEEAIATAKMNPEEKNQAIEKAQLTLKEAETNWLKIRRTFQGKCQQKSQYLKEKMLSDKSQLLETLTYELNRTQSPKTWWEQDLPFRLKRELLALNHKLEDFVIKAIASDFDWLQKEVNQNFSLSLTCDPNLNQNMINQEKNANYNISKLELSDLQKYRLLTRCGGSAAMVATTIFGGPFGILASLGTTLLGEKLLNQEIDQQRQIITCQLEPNLNQVFEQYYQKTTQRLAVFYNQLLEDIKQEQNNWLSAKKEAINNINYLTSAETFWQPIIEKSLALKTEILTVRAN